jgi:hypothetical protein
MWVLQGAFFFAKFRLEALIEAFLFELRPKNASIFEAFLKS